MINILTIILISQLFSESTAYITSDSGIAEQFKYPWTGSRFNQVNFKMAFENIPKVLITPFHYEFPVSSQLYGFKISISEVATTYFVLLLSIKYGEVNTLKIKWFAIDDQRIEVIHKFNQDIPLASSDVPHFNKNQKIFEIVLLQYKFWWQSCYRL